MNLSDQIDEVARPPATHNGGPAIDDNPWARDGYVKIARAMRDHPIVGFGQSVDPAEPERRFCFSRAEAWQDLIMECRYSAGLVVNKGHTMEIKPGQLLGAISWLASRWNWTPKTVRWFLDQLQAEQMISRSEPASAKKATEQEHGKQEGKQDGKQKGKQKGKHNGNQTSVLSICNYEIYQMVLQAQRQAKGQAVGQPEGQATRQPEGQANGKTLIKEEREELKIYIQRGGERAHEAAPTAVTPSVDQPRPIASVPSPSPQHDAAKPVLNWRGDSKVMVDLMMEACGPALDNPVNCMGLYTAATAIMWTNEGCDFELDVLETLKAFGRSHAGKRINSWNYFTRAVEKARDTRMKGMAKPPKLPPKSASHSPEGRSKHWLENTEPGRAKVRDVGLDAAAAFFADHLEGQVITPDGYTIAEIEAQERKAYAILNAELVGR